MCKNAWVRILALIGAVTLGIVMPAAAGTVNFDDIPGSGSRTWSGDRYLSVGVLFSSSATLYAFNSADANTPPTWVYGSSTGGSSANGTVVVDMVLPNTATPTVTGAISFWVYDSESAGATWSASIYGLSNNLLNTISGTAQTAQVSFTQAGIHRLVFTPSSDLEGFDSLNFDSSAGGVPEPGTLALFALGAAALVIRRRLVRRA
jgi:hypothetical protein